MTGRLPARDRPSAVVALAPTLAADIGHFDRRAHAGGMPYHVSVLYPWVREHRAVRPALVHLREIAAAVDPFTFAFTRVAEFPGGISHLRVSPEDPFVALTRAIEQRWPASPHYGGAFDEIVPHATLAYRPLHAGERRRVEQKLPITVQLRSLAVLERHWRRWRTVTNIDLGDRS